MKDLVALCAIGMLPGMLVAQPVMDESSAPQVGDFLTYTSANYVPIPLGGENVLWDLSGLAPGAESSLSFTEPSATGFGDLYPSATLALDGGTVIQFMRSDATGLYVVGVYKEIGATTLQIHFTDEQLFLPYPCTYNTVFTDTLAYYYDYSGGTVNGGGNSSYTADGFGTLVLPYDTIYNVLKVTGVDTSMESVPGTTYLTVSHTVYFYKPGLHYYLLSATQMTQTVNGGQPQSANYGYYLSEGMLTAVGEQARKGIGVEAWPVPSHDRLNVSYGVAGDRQVDVQLYDATGRSVRSVRQHTVSSGMQNTLLDVKGLPAGIYLLKVIDDHGQRGSRSVVIE
jgi:hypothetical protein